MKTVEKINQDKVAYNIVYPQDRLLIWRKAAGILKGKIKNPARKLAQIRKEWDRY